MSAIFPLTLGQSNINLTDTSNPNNELTINGRFVYIEDTSNNVVTSNIAWSQLINRVDNCDAVVANPNDFTLKLNNTLLLDNGVNSRTITPLSNPATTIDVGQTDLNITYYPVFTDASGNSKSLLTDINPTALSYNPNTSTLTATTFSGTATGINLTGNSANAERNVIFNSANAGGSRTLLIDTSGNNLMYNAGLQRLSVSNIRTFGTISSPNNITIDPTNILTIQGDTEIFGQLDMENFNIVNCPQVRNNAGNIEIKANSTGAGGNILLTAGTDLLSATSGGSAGLHLKLTINGTAYKIALLNV
jgi:hypothetical protein